MTANQSTQGETGTPVNQAAPVATAASDTTLAPAAPPLASAAPVAPAPSDTTLTPAAPAAPQLANAPSAAVAAFWPDGHPTNFVGGRDVDTAERTEVIDPSTGVAYSSAPVSSISDVQTAIDIASQAQIEWGRRPLSERVALVTGLAKPLAEWGERLALLESIDTGNPMASTRRDVSLGVSYLTQWPAQTLARVGRASQPHADGLSMTTRVPYGVVGKIIAYNHPSLFAVSGMIFALLAGNTMVIKCADQTPLATLALSRIIADALPDGVVNIVAGRAEAGDCLTTSPDIKRLAFTGSDTTALMIQSRLSNSGLVKHFTAELGGKNAIVIFDDTDVEAAADAVVAGASLRISQGQSCQATARVLVHQNIEATLTQAVAKRLANLRIGPSYDETCDMGPLVSAAQLRHVEQLVDDASSAGATVVFGGDRPAHTNPGGFYYQPTLLTGVTPSMKIATEEVFGPVITVQPFATEAEAVRLANDTRLGLSAAVWSNSIDRAMRVAFALEAGYVWVNDSNRHYPGAPFGGLKASGTGREESIEEYDSYSQLRSVNIRVPGLTAGFSDAV